jgi:hypothetical protein
MRVRIRAGWEQAGRVGRVLGQPVAVGPSSWSYTPIVWDGDNIPSWHRSSGLMEIATKKECYILREGGREEREIPESKKNFPAFVHRGGAYFQFVRSDEDEVIYQEVVFEKA